MLSWRGERFPKRFVMNSVCGRHFVMNCVCGRHFVMNCVCVVDIFLTSANICYFVYWFVKFEKGHSSFF